MSTKRKAKLSKLVRGPGGRWLCRCGCGREVEPPRRTWFSDDCVHGWKIKNDPGYARDQVWRRDRGVCAACGCDTEAERQRARSILLEGWSRPQLPDLVRLYSLSSHPVMLHYREAGFPGISRSWWEMDHIVEVVRGGGGCGLDNLQTLCVPCHKAKTSRLRKELAKLKRTASAPAKKPKRGGKSI